MSTQLAAFIPWFPALSAVLCGFCCMRRSWRVWAAPVCIGAIALSLLFSFLVYGSVAGAEHGTAGRAFAFTWMHVGDFKVDFAYFLDPLTMVMLFVVTGVGLLVTIYAAGYMKGERGYARFFVGVSLFIFAMTTLVMADNLVLLYLGWEGVGLCSYLLIGYYYDRPTAVAAAKKAFIVNRIGDLGFALGIFLTYTTFSTVSLAEVTTAAREMLAHGDQPQAAQLWIPFLLMLGAFGKSAQIPLYVWLPDAMEGPTPVSALIHAATMVTAGVYMIARMLPVFELSTYALPTVATVGAATALFAATIALCQYDLKRIYAYSTISQLGYMFLGVGVLSSVGGMFHLFTHAFFKALLFLTAGNVMHALAGQLDLRKISGLRRKMPWTCWLMFAGCLALAGFPFTAGFYSKDMILAAAIDRGTGEHGNPWMLILGIVGLVTALLTAFYTFRLWFRVFLGPERYEMGQEHHADEPAHGGEEESGAAAEHHHEPHEMPWLMNGPLVVLALGAIFAGVLFGGWMDVMVTGSTAAPAAGHGAGHGAEAGDAAGHGAVLLGMSLHTAMMVISSVIAITGIALAAYFHWLKRDAADRAAEMYPGIVRTLANKYYVDELYDTVIVTPLRVVAHTCHAIDRLIIDGLVAFVGFVPRAMGLAVSPSQRGVLQGYGLGMVIGVALIVLVMLMIVM